MRNREKRILQWLVAGVFLFACAIAPVQSQDLKKRYTLTLPETTLEQALDQVKTLTGYNFAYRKELVNGKRTAPLSVKDATLSSILTQLLKPHGLQFGTIEGVIVIQKATVIPKEFKNKQVIMGKVVDEQNEPLPGASVMQEGTTTGVTTDMDGVFSIMVSLSEEPVLVVRFVGMKSRRIRVKEMKEYTIRMEQDITSMDEVVVTGYQNIKREIATGAYQTISSKDLDNRYTSDIISNLEGRIPGLVSYNTGLNGDPDSNIMIRGVSTFTTQTRPLVVVDGLPIEGSIETINPYDIESVTVLKDAAAASIYGARASNGVIIVTTKRARSEKIEVSFSADLTISEKQKYDNYNYASTAELFELEEANYEATKNDPIYSMYLPMYAAYYPQYLSTVTRNLVNRDSGAMSAGEYDAWKASVIKNDYMKEWSDVVLRNQILQQYNLSVRTKSKRLSSILTANYKTTNNGIVREHNAELSLSYRGDFNVSKWLDVSFGTNILSTRGKTHDDTFGLLTSPTAFEQYQSIYNEDGSKAYYQAKAYLGLPSLSDPSYGLKSETYNLIDELGYNFIRTRNTNLRTFIHATAKILPQLTVTGQFQYEDRSSKTSTYLEKDSYTMRHIYNLYTTGGKHLCPDGGILDSTNGTGDHYTFRGQANYNQTFGKHEIEAVAGAEVRETRTRSVSDRIIGYDDKTQTNSMTSVNLAQIRTYQSGYNYSDLGTGYSPIWDYRLASGWSTSDVKHRYTSLYFTGNYMYDKRYSASLSYRVDKTDLFGADPKFRGRPLWSVGGSWNLHNEAFLKDVRNIDVLKLRLTYGLTGNIDTSASSYLTARIYNHYYINDTKGAAINTPPNDQLRWEKTASWNLGIDYAFFGNRLSGSLDLYRKYSTDLLSQTELDPTTGWSTLTINNGKAINQGVELQVNAKILKPSTVDDLGINLLWNIAYNKNKIKKITYAPTMGIAVLGWGQSSHTLMEGKPINSLWAWKFAGFEKDANGYQQYTWYKADGSVTNTGIYGELEVEDCIYMGGLDPKYTSSLTPEISYKGFTLSAMLAYYGGHYMRGNVDAWMPSGSAFGYGNVANKSALNFWKDPDANLYPPCGVYSYAMSMESQGIPFIDQCVLPADYLKVRNIVLGYNIPNKFCRKFGIHSARVRVQMNNVATWVKNDYDIDPEANNAWTGYKQNETPKSYTMSLSVNF